MNSPSDIAAKQALILRLIQKHRLHVHPKGNGAVRVTGVGVDVSAAGMRWLSPSDVTPIYSKRSREPLQL
jgi:hypothetical protein